MTRPAGVFSETYDQDQAIVRTRPQWFWFLGFMIFLFTLPLFGGGRSIGIMNIIGITVIAVVGLQINVGYAGQINWGSPLLWGWEPILRVLWRFISISPFGLPSLGRNRRGSFWGYLWAGCCQNQRVLFSPYHDSRPIHLYVRNGKTTQSMVWAS